MVGDWSVSVVRHGQGSPVRVCREGEKYTRNELDTGEDYSDHWDLSESCTLRLLGHDGELTERILGACYLKEKGSIGIKNGHWASEPASKLDTKWPQAALTSNKLLHVFRPCGDDQSVPVGSSTHCPKAELRISYRGAPLFINSGGHDGLG